MLSEQLRIEAWRIVCEWGNTGTSYFINEKEYELIKVLSKALIAVIKHSAYDNEENLHNFVLGILATAASIGRAHDEQPKHINQLIDDLQLDLQWDE